MLREEAVPIPSPSVSPDWPKPIAMLSFLSPVIDLDMDMGSKTYEEIYWESSGKERDMQARPKQLLLSRDLDLLGHVACRVIISTDLRLWAWANQKEEKTWIS
jgi:hypothetical protein